MTQETTMRTQYFVRKERACEGCNTTLIQPSIWRRFCEDCVKERKRIGAKIRYLKMKKKTISRKRKLMKALKTGNKYTIMELANITGYKPNSIPTIINQLKVKLTRRTCVYLEKPIKEGI
ncbi:hypothetical protein LCGC14_2622240 [marine sediment metagenome]|uniref:Uncharacterized protein n=1 Tax=marine sediment metagenome TaxID=412755 RepID=A0A0F9CVC9_9ZZZZ|nr:hypothetical protein [bacterium]